MRKNYEANTLDEAINNAMIDLSITSDKLVYSVLQNGSAGFLGIGSKPFIIEAYSKDDKEEVYKDSNKNNKLVKNEKGEYEFNATKKRENNAIRKLTRNPEEVMGRAKEFLDPIFKTFDMNITMDYEAQVDINTIVINLKGEKMGVLIGKHGQTLDALQHLTNIIVNTGETDKVHIRMDSEKYRDKRMETLENLAKSVASNVRRTKRDYALEPMSSYERRIIHSILQKEKNIETVSEGMDRKRHVVVKYKRY